MTNERREGQLKQKELSVRGFKISVDNTSGNVPLSCAFLGPNGTYTEQAAKELLTTQVVYPEAKRITEIIKGIETGKFDTGLVPIENSSEGNVAETVREVIKSDLTILAEHVIPIHHVLFGTDAALAKGVIRSHPQAIGQCANWLEKNLKNGEVIEHNSTADAIRVAAERDELAIGNRKAGDLYNIPIHAENIEDRKGNTTRFWLLGRGETEQTENDRTTILFSLKNRTGLLRNALAVFADRSINMTKIDSFPIGALDEYYFMMSIDGHTNEPRIKEALVAFRDVCLKVRILGSYNKTLIPDKFLDPGDISNGWLKPES